jgi:hypothetical protein
MLLRHANIACDQLAALRLAAQLPIYISVAAVRVAKNTTSQLQNAASSLIEVGVQALQFY